MNEKEIINLLLIKNNENINNNIKQYNIKLKELLSLKDLELKNEPSILLKSKHNKWKSKINNIDRQIINIYDIIENELNIINNNLEAIKDK